MGEPGGRGAVRGLAFASSSSAGSLGHRSTGVAAAVFPSPVSAWEPGAVASHFTGSRRGKFSSGSTCQRQPRGLTQDPSGNRAKQVLSSSILER